MGRIQGLLAIYFFVLLVQTLRERELRQAMARKGIDSLPLSPEGRPCSRPTTGRVIEVFEMVQRHLLVVGDNQPQCPVTELTTLQRRIIKLLSLPPLTTAVDPPLAPAEIPEILVPRLAGRRLYSYPVLKEDLRDGLDLPQAPQTGSGDIEKQRVARSRQRCRMRPKDNLRKEAP